MTIDTNEALSRVKQTEEDAAKLVKQAKKVAQKQTVSAKKAAQAAYEKMMTDGKMQAEKRKDVGRREGQDEAASIIHNGKIAADTIRQMDEKRMEEAVQLIIERIVQNNGNR